MIGLAVVSSDSGVRVDRVVEGSPGATAGFHAGDIIRSLDGARISDPSAFTATVAKRAGGDRVRIAILRNNQPLTLEAVLAPRPREISQNAEVIYDQVRVRVSLRRIIATKPHVQGKLPAVLIMQGLGCYSIDNPDRASGYGRIVSELEKRGFATLRVEKTGMGDSEGPDCTSLEATVNLEAEGYVEALRKLKSYSFIDPNRIFVVAHSMGPVVGSLAMAREKVNGVIAVETVGTSWFEYDLERSRLQHALSGAAPDEVDAYMRAYTPCSYRFYLGKEKPEDLDRAPACAGFTKPFGGTPYTYMQGVAEIKLGEQWKNIDAPALVIYGTASPVTSAAQNHYLVNLINRLHPGNATYAEVPGMGHDFNLYASREEYWRESRKPGHSFHEGFLDVMMPWLRGL